MSNTLKKIFSFATLTLIVALSLSGIAAWYSILGLTAIFAAAVIPIIIMGAALEVAKVVTTVWLHRYWDKCGWQLKLYLVPAVITLAFITSMGIFGFLSKSHADQTLVSGDSSAKIAVYDEKIAIAKDNIETNRAALAQMDEQVNQTLSRTDNLQGANRAVQIRRQQASEREALLAEISKSQTQIATLNEEAAPLRAQFRKIEAEVGPIKYIAALIYGDNPGTDLLEKAVRWVIIIIVFVFDPLALTLVLASQKSYQWLNEDLRRRKDEQEPEERTHSPTTLDPEPESEPVYKEEDTQDEPSSDEPDDMVGEDLLQAPNEPTHEDSTILDGGKDENIKLTTPIQTEGVTFLETSDNYVSYNGKTSSKQALAELRPDLFINRTSSNTAFGTSFPPFAKKGQVFVRVDTKPNTPYEFDGYAWVEISKPSALPYDQQYIKHLVEKIDAGEYDIDLLTDKEKEQIEEYLKSI